MIIVTGPIHITTDTEEEFNQALGYVETDPMSSNIVSDEIAKTIDFDYSNNI